MHSVQAFCIFYYNKKRKKTDKFTIRLEDHATPLSITDRSIRFKNHYGYKKLNNCGLHIFFQVHTKHLQK